MKAPIAIESPLAAVINAVPITTRRQAAMKNSVEPATATMWNSGRSTSRPAMMMRPIAGSATAKVAEQSAAPTPRCLRLGRARRRG